MVTVKIPNGYFSADSYNSSDFFIDNLNKMTVSVLKAKISLHRREQSRKLYSGTLWVCHFWLLPLCEHLAGERDRVLPHWLPLEHSLEGEWPLEAEDDEWPERSLCVSAPPSLAGIPSLPPPSLWKCPLLWPFSGSHPPSRLRKWRPWGRWLPLLLSRGEGSLGGGGVGSLGGGGVRSWRSSPGRESLLRHPLVAERPAVGPSERRCRPLERSVLTRKRLLVLRSGHFILGNVYHTARHVMLCLDAR